MTQFSVVYDRFLGKITDDMYLEWTKEDTLKDMQSILLDAIQGFEFPRFRPNNYELSSLTTTKNEEGNFYIDTSCFEDDLTSEEINILAVLMVIVWLNRQIASVEQIRMKYSGSDFKMTSQANHLAKLLLLKTELVREDRHGQRLYKRRKSDKDGNIRSNWSVLIEKRAIE